MADSVRDRHEVRADKADRARRVRDRVLVGEPRDEREGGDQEDPQRVREPDRRPQNSSGAEAAPTPSARERDCPQRRHGSDPHDQLQRRLPRLRAHGHRSSPDHQVLSVPQQRSLPVFPLSGLPTMFFSPTI